MKVEKIKTIIFASTIILIILSLIFLKNNLTGLVIYEIFSNFKNWTFDDDADYVYNSNLIKVSNGEASLIAAKKTNVWTQTSQLDFENGTMENLNSSLSPGTLKLSSKSDWWDNNYKYRSRLTIKNKADDILESGYSVKFVVDAKSLISGNKLKPNCDDLRIVYFDGSSSKELDRINETACNYALTEIWIKTNSPISFNSSDSSYYIYYGNPNANVPPADRNNIYVWWDDFSANTLSSYSVGDWLCYQGDCKSFKNFTYSSGHLYFNATEEYGSALKLGLSLKDAYAKATYSVNKSYPKDSTLGIGLRWTAAKKYYTGDISGGEYPSPALAKKERTKYVKKSDSNLYHPKDGTEFTLSFAVWSKNLKLWYNNDEKLSEEDNELKDAGDVVFEAAQAAGYIKDILVRKYTEPEPSASIGTEETRYEYKGNFTSPWYSSPYSSWEDLKFDSEAPSGTSIKFKVRTANKTDALNNSIWYGPSSVSDYYTISGTKLNAVHEGSNLLQYAAFFDGDGTATPALNEVAIASSALYYPSNASIETKDYGTGSLLNFNSFSKSDFANGSNISYYYSLDSGLSWNSVPVNNNLSSINSSGGKIRLKAQLLSNGNSTPILYDFGVYYRTRVCIENWSVNYRECLNNDKKIKYYADLHECGSNKYLPADNNTYVSCDYCTPKWVFRKCNNAADNNSCFAYTNLSSDLYNGNYSEFNFDCTYNLSVPSLANFKLDRKTGKIGDIINITINLTSAGNITSVNLILGNEGKDIAMNIGLYSKDGMLFNGIINTENLTEGTYFIAINISDDNGNSWKFNKKGILGLYRYAKNAFLNSSVQFQKNKKTQLNVSDAKSMLDILTSADIENASVAVVEFSNNTKNATANASALGKYIDIVLDDSIKQNISLLAIKMYYTDEDLLAAGIAESSLKIHYFNETSSRWQELNSTVNTTEKSVAAVVDHASTYGVFGNKKQDSSSSESQNTHSSTQSSAQSSGSGGGGGGSAAGSSYGGDGSPIQTSTTNNETAKKGEQEAGVKAGADEIVNKCKYDFNIKILENDLIMKNNTLRGDIENLGNCKINGIELMISKNLKDYIDIEYASRELEENKSAEFVLKIKNLSQNKKTFLGGFSVKTTAITIKRINGDVSVSAASQDGTPITKKIPIKADIEVTEKINSNIMTIGISIIIIVIFLSLFVWFRIKGKNWNGRKKAPENKENTK